MQHISPCRAARFNGGSREGLLQWLCASPVPSDSHCTKVNLLHLELQQIHCQPRQQNLTNLTQVSSPDHGAPWRAISCWALSHDVCCTALDPVVEVTLHALDTQVLGPAIVTSAKAFRAFPSANSRLTFFKLCITASSFLMMRVSYTCPCPYLYILILSEMQ